MKSCPAFSFYPSDWLRDPGLRSCSLGARGLWIDLLAFMHESEPYGHLRVNGKDIGAAAIARMVGSSLNEIKKFLRELEDAGVFSRTTQRTIFSRRMVRDQELREKRGQYGQLSATNPAVPRKKDTMKDTMKDTFPPSFPPSIGGSPSSSSSSSLSSSSSSPDSDSEKKEKIAGSASPSPASGTTPKRRALLSDKNFIAELKSNPAYTAIDIDREIGKCQAWLLTPKGKGKQLTRARLVNWLNKIDVPMHGASTQKPACSKRIQGQGDRFLRDCGQPASPESRPTEPRCAEHLKPVSHLQTVTHDAH